MPGGLVINPRRTCVVRVTVLGLCVLLNISFFTWLFVPQTILTFSAADEGWKFKHFLWKCFIAKLEVSCWYGYMISWLFFTPRKHACVWIWTMRLAAILFLGEEFFASLLIILLLAIGSKLVCLSWRKLCPQCKAAVPVRWKTCECCDHSSDRFLSTHRYNYMHCCAEDLALQYLSFLSDL